MGNGGSASGGTILRPYEFEVHSSSVLVRIIAIWATHLQSVAACYLVRRAVSEGDVYQHGE